MHQSVFGPLVEHQQRGNWPPAQPAAAQRVTDCSAVVLDGVWPRELMNPGPDTIHLAQHLDQDLRKIVERTNEELRKLGGLNLAEVEYRAAEERFIRVARSMAILRVESTVRQLGGRSILGAQGMPSLTAAPVRDRRAVNDPFESTTVVSPEVIAQARRMAEQREAEQTRIVPVVSPPYRGDSPADVEQTQVFARHRVEEQPAAVQMQASATPGEPVIIDQVEAEPVRPTMAAAPPSSQFAGENNQDRAGLYEPRAQVGDDFGRPYATEPVGAGRHREPAESPAPDERPRQWPSDDGVSQRLFGGDIAAPRVSRESLRPLGFSEPLSASRPAPPVRPVPPVNGMAQPSVNGRGPVNGHGPVAPVHPPAPPRQSGPLALEQPVTLEQMVGSLARQQPSLKWLVAQRADGSTVAVCDVMSGWIPPGIKLPVGVTVLVPEERSEPMHEWVGSMARSATYGPGQRIERRNVTSVAGEEAFAVVAVAEDLGDLVAAATNRPGLPRIANTLVRAAVSGSGVLPAELDVLNVHLETAVQMLLAGAPGVNADEALSCMLMGAAAAIAAGQARLAAYHYGWFEAIAGRRGK